MNILCYTFFRNALLGSLLASIVCSFIGIYIVTHRLVFISGGIMHASFDGIGLGVFLGFNPIVSTILSVILSACDIQWMSHRSDAREDSAIALFWAFGVSVGITCCFLTPGSMSDLPSFLFGDILTISRGDLLLLAVLSLLLLAIFALLFHPILSVAFDPCLACSQKLPVSAIEYVVMTLIAMTTVSTLRIAGVVLAVSPLTIPQMTTNLFTYNYKRIIAHSILVEWVDCLLGLTFGYLLNIPSGATVIFVNIIIYALLKAIKVLIFKFNQREASPS